MAQHNEWGPWIEHDGMPVPHLAGEWLHIIGADGREGEGMLKFAGAKGSLWRWKTILKSHWSKRIIRYRIRKPRGLIILQDLIENLPAPTATEQEKA